MERITETTKKMVVILYDHDDKETERYHLHAPRPDFCDVANTLDHLRQTGLQPYDDKPKAVAAGKK